MVPFGPLGFRRLQICPWHRGEVRRETRGFGDVPVRKRSIGIRLVGSVLRMRAWIARYTSFAEGAPMQGDFRIGDRTVVPTLNQILHDGAAVHVEPKAMRVLLYLAARRGEVAGREELFRAVWPDTFVTDDVLKRCVSDLRKALGDEHRNPRFIETIPKVGYRLLSAVEPVEPLGEVRRAFGGVTLDAEAAAADRSAASEGGLRLQTATSAAVVARGTRRRRTAITIGGVVLIGAVGAAAYWVLRPREASAPYIVQLRAERLVESSSFSPDGNQVAYSAPGDDGGYPDIWVNIVGEAETHRLTTDRAFFDTWPAWAPDGKQIAFVRFPSGGGPGSVYVVSPLGGVERQLLDFAVRGTSLSWSPDGRWLAAAQGAPPTSPFGTGIYLIPTAGGESRQVTFPNGSSFHTAPAFSPDGSALAYASCQGPEGSLCYVWTLSLDAEARPHGAPRRLTQQGAPTSTLAWTRDGGFIIYGADWAAGARLWRVRADGSAAPEREELAGPGVFNPSTVPCCDRLAYVRDVGAGSIYRFEPGVGAAPLIRSAFFDGNAHYSPDGRRIAFSSDRADERPEVWLANADGTAVTRLTRGPGRHQGSPRWSPDGRAIAFDSQAGDGRWDIWTIGIDGSGLRQITRDKADENMPSWSHDGQFLYYGSNRTGRYEIWRVPASGGTEEQVTHGGGFLPFESRDGRTLYYLRRTGGELLARPTAGGEERLIVPCVDRWDYAVGPNGIFHIDCLGQGGRADLRRALRYWVAATQQDREVAILDLGPGHNLGLSASPDGRSVIYSPFTHEHHLMMIENFR
jgi:Tol biopolymer transport system component/DNA-binding winged helix-turn-helix (wHTH) protein